MFKIAVVAAACALFAATAAGAGDEKGKVILGFGAGPLGPDAMDLLSLRSTDRHHHSAAAYFATRHHDFTDAFEKGDVIVLSLDPGDWEIFNYQLRQWQAVTTAKHDFSVPFTVKAGETIYIGDYTSHGGLIWRTPSGALRVGDYRAGFIVSDKRERDIAVAKAKDPAIGDVSAAIPDFAALGSPFFASADDKTLVTTESLLHPAPPGPMPAN